MIYLVTGGSGSGKSAYAEELVLEAGRAKCFYVAAMEVFGEEERKKVERHRKLRQGKGFITVECPRELNKLVLGETKENCVVLLECVGNLAANELFSAESQAEMREGPCMQARIEAAGRRIKEGIQRLEEQCRLLVAVSSEVFSDGIDYGEETNGYIRLLGELNCWLGERACRAVEVVYGIPVVLKDKHW